MRVLEKFGVTALVVISASCSKKLDGPTPSVNGVSPPAICQVQLTSTVELSGAGLSPLLTGALKNSQLELPTVSLVRAQDLTGAATTDAAVFVPDDPLAPEKSKVRWLSQEKMSLQLEPALALVPGLYDINVANPNGKTGTFAASLLAVPPPSLTKISPDILCGDKDNLVELTGDFFIKGSGSQPMVSFDDKQLMPASMSDCRTLPGTAGLQACKTLTVSVPSKTLAFGAHAVSVVNPAPVGCASTEKVTLTLTPEPTLSSVVPDLVCTAEADTTLTVTGTGFLTIDGVMPKLTLSGGSTTTLPATASNCSPVPGPLETVQTCTTLIVTLPKSALSAGAFLATVGNPAPADCSTRETIKFQVVAPPTVVSVLPDIACAEEGIVNVTLTGSGFLTIGGAVPSVSVGTLVLVPSASGCTALTGSTQLAQTCTSLSVSVPQATAAGVYPVTVKNPAPAGCSSGSSISLTLFGKPQIVSVAPLAVCTQSADKTVLITGSGFVTVGAAVPTVKVGGLTYVPTAGGCTPVTGATEVVQVCTSLTVSIATGTQPVGTQPVVVTNPVPVGCSSVGTGSLKITPPPTLTSAAPTTLCRGGGTLSLAGTNFAAGATVKLGTVNATSVTVTNATTAIANLPGGLPTGTFQVALSNADGCAATLATSVTVIPGPAIFFVDPSVVYNGISVQGAVYGTGFTGAVQSVSLIPSGGGTSIPLTFTVNAGLPNQVQVIVPKAIAAGVYDMQLQDTTTCGARLANAVTVVSTTTLVLGTPPIVPAFGWTSQSTGVTILAAAAATGFVAVPRVYLNPSTPGPTSVATVLGAVSFNDATHLSAVVRSGLPVDTYDLIVVNPDGKVGYAPSAYRVTALKPPTISDLSPGSVTNTNPQSFDVVGADFRTPSVTLSCVDSAGVPLAVNPSATLSSPSATKVTVTFNASLAGAACVVRLTDGDNNTFADFAALVITNPAGNLSTATAGPSLITARRAPAVLGGDATSAARFLHVIAGDDGATTAFDAVESSSLSLLGIPSAFFIQRTRLTQARAFAGGVRIGRWLYVAGGSAAGVAKNTAERAIVLNPDQREEIADLNLDISEVGGVGPGLWYYRVAAVMNASDPFNPGGENLAADPFPVQLPTLIGQKVNVTVKWKSDPNAAKYRVYRSPLAGATVGTEQVIGEVTAPLTSFQDTGLTPINPENPLPIGSLGKWQLLSPTLALAREGAGVAWGLDPVTATKAYLYVLGGRQNVTTVSKTYEFIDITLNPDGSQTVGPVFTTGTTQLAAARWQLSASRAGHDLSSRIPAGQTYIYAQSGTAADGTNVINNTEAALVAAGGQLGTFIALPTSQSRAGYVSIVAGNFVFGFGGSNAMPDTSIRGGEICGPGVNGCNTNPTPPFVINFNAGQTMLMPRYLTAGTLSGAYIYVAGGVTTASPLTLTKTTEYRLW